MRTAMFVLLGTLAVIVFGDTAGKELAVAVPLVGAGLYGILASTRYPFPGIELFQSQRDLVPLVTADEKIRRYPHITTIW